MTNVDIILDYAASHDGTLVRKEFTSWFEASYPDGSLRSMDTELRQMVADGVLERTGYGHFRLTSEAKLPYVPAISEEMIALFSGIKEKYPYTDFCIWQAREISSFMQHVPAIDILILETDRAASEAVYDDARELARGRTALLRPTEKECRLYASGEPSLIVRDLISEAPVIRMNGVVTASLEKILVDVTITREFEFTRGSETYTIYENAARMYHIAKKTMLRYASRRGKKEEIERLMKSTMQ